VKTFNRKPPWRYRQGGFRSRTAEVGLTAGNPSFLLVLLLVLVILFVILLVIVLEILFPPVLCVGPASAVQNRLAIRPRRVSLPCEVALPSDGRFPNSQQRTTNNQ